MQEVEGGPSERKEGTRGRRRRKTFAGRQRRVTWSISPVLFVLLCSKFFFSLWFCFQLTLLGYFEVGVLNLSNWKFCGSISNVCYFHWFNSICFNSGIELIYSYVSHYFILCAWYCICNIVEMFEMCSSGQMTTQTKHFSVTYPSPTGLSLLLPVS